MQQNNQSLVVPFFKSVPVENPAMSKAAGRPIFEDVDMVEVRIAGERNYTPTFPAHAMWRRVDGEEITYAQRFADEYARFAAGKEQVAVGTPLSELPFLTEARRAELRACKVYTAEALASIEGKNLAALGLTGREMKNQAQAYLESAGGSAKTVALAAEVNDLRAQLAAMRGEEVVALAPATDDEKERLKSQIADMTGQRPRGNPSVDTLREMLSDLKATA